MSALARLLWMGWLAAAVGAGATPAPLPDAGCEAHAPVPWQAVAPGVWVWLPDQQAELAPGRQGPVLPVSVVVDAGEAMVIDPGPHARLGQRVRQSLVCQFGARVRWVINTHAHAENVLGNAAFADLQATGQVAIAASAGARAAMQSRCESCLAALTQTLGAPAMAGTSIVLPNHPLIDGDEMAVGRLRLRVVVAPLAHTESDLMLWLAPSRVLWAGGLVYDGRVPELAQGSLNGWLAALRRMALLQPRVVVATVVSVAPDASGLPPALGATRDYLRSLARTLWQAMEAGQYAGEVPLTAGAGYETWVGFRARQAFNVQRAWRELESIWISGAGVDLDLDAAPDSVPDVGR